MRLKDSADTVGFAIEPNFDLTTEGDIEISQSAGGNNKQFKWSDGSAGGDGSLGGNGTNFMIWSRAGESKWRADRLSGASFNRANTWGALSSARIKRDVRPLRGGAKRTRIEGIDVPDTGATTIESCGLTEILALEPIAYHLRGEPDQQHLGFIAEEVEKTIPLLVGTEGDEKLLAENNLIAVLVRAVQELAERVDALESSSPSRGR